MKNQIGIFQNTKPNLTQIRFWPIFFKCQNVVYGLVFFALLCLTPALTALAADQISDLPPTNQTVLPNVTTPSPTLTLPDNSSNNQNTQPPSAELNPPSAAVDPGATQNNSQNNPSLTIPATNKGTDNKNMGGNAPTNPTPAPTLPAPGLTMQDLQNYEKILAQSQNNSASSAPEKNKGTKPASKAAVSRPRQEIAFKFPSPKPQTVAPVIQNAASSLWAPLVNVWVPANSTYAYSAGNLNPRITFLLYGLAAILFTGGVLIINRDAKKRAGIKAMFANTNNGRTLKLKV